MVAVNEELHEAEQVTPSGLPGPRGAACPRAADSPPAHYPHPETSVGGPAFPPEGRGGIKHPGFTPVCSQGYRGGQRAHPTCCDPLLGAMLSKRSPRCPAHMEVSIPSAPKPIQRRKLKQELPWNEPGVTAGITEEQFAHRPFSSGDPAPAGVPKTTQASEYHTST